MARPFLPRLSKCRSSLLSFVAATGMSTNWRTTIESSKGEREGAPPSRPIFFSTPPPLLSIRSTALTFFDLAHTGIPPTYPVISPFDSHRHLARRRLRFDPAWIDLLPPHSFQLDDGGADSGGGPYPHHRRLVRGGRLRQQRGLRDMSLRGADRYGKRNQYMLLRKGRGTSQEEEEMEMLGYSGVRQRKLEWNTPRTCTILLSCRPISQSWTPSQSRTGYPSWKRGR